MKYYLITDTHFGHAIMRDYCGRPEDFENNIFKNLEKVTDREQSVLIHLGDICIGQDAFWHEQIVKAWPGKRWLARGNHDGKSNHWYLSHGWDFVADQFTMTFEGKKILFSHYPMAWDGYYDHNIHGHFHNSDHRRHEPEFVKLKNGYQKLLAIEYTDYAPVELSSFITPSTSEAPGVKESR